MKTIFIIGAVVAVYLCIKSAYNFNKSMDTAYDMINDIDGLSVELDKDIYTLELRSNISGKDVVTRESMSFNDILNQYGAINYFKNPGRIWRKIILKFICEHTYDISDTLKSLQ